MYLCERIRASNNEYYIILSHDPFIINPSRITFPPDSLGGVTYDVANRPGIANLLDIYAATLNSQRQKQHFQTLHNKLSETAVMRYGMLRDPALLYAIASQGLNDSALEMKTQYISGNSAVVSPTAPSTLPEFDAIVDEFLAVSSGFDKGCEKVSLEALAEEHKHSKLVDFKVCKRFYAHFSGVRHFLRIPEACIRICVRLNVYLHFLLCRPLSVRPLLQRLALFAKEQQHSSQIRHSLKLFSQWVLLMQMTRL